jgi:hypothetical protein
MYTELHCHSAYSFLDGASEPAELAAAAADFGYEALALTDHDGVYGAMEFAHACTGVGIRPIVGTELTVECAPSPPLPRVAPRGAPSEESPCRRMGGAAVTGPAGRAPWSAYLTVSVPSIPASRCPGTLQKNV